MARKIHDSREEIIDKIIKHINSKLPAKTAKLATAFIAQFLANSPIEDLVERDILDLYGALISHWNLIYHRAPSEAKVHVYNPQFEQHGWVSSHTVIEVAHDDMPFLVDSLRMEINRLGFTVHFMINMGDLKLRRNEKHEVVEVLPFDAPAHDCMLEAPIYIEIDRQTDPSILQELHDNLIRVLHDVSLAVNDWPHMKEKVQQAIAELEANPPPLDPTEVAESKDFLRWLVNDHFTFLGYRDYELVTEGSEKALKLIPDSGLGVLHDSSKSKMFRPFSSLPPAARKIALSSHILVITKTNTKSTVHVPKYTDYIGIKRFNAAGELIGERRVIGLYTSTAYSSNPKYVPFLRHKVAEIMRRSKLPARGHAGKELLSILETLPRDDLFQASIDELFELAMGILHLQERQRIRLFIRKDVYSRFISCLVFMPREDINTEIRAEMEEVLGKAFQALEVTFTTHFSESVLARIHFVFRIDSKKHLDYDVKELEEQMVTIGRPWKDKLRDQLIEFYGEEKGIALANKYDKSFPAGYRENYSSRTAVYDINHIERLSSEHTLEMSFYRPLDEPEGIIRFKLYQQEHHIPLSDVLPILENMGLRVIGERPHQIIFKNGSSVWINDFGMIHEQSKQIDVDALKELFQDAFHNIWHGDAENDRFNRLALAAQLNWREISVLRAYAKYLKQAGFTFSQAYIEETLSRNADIAKQLIVLFKLRLDPQLIGDNDEHITQLEENLEKALDSVTILDEDRILRRFHACIYATLRTNYFQYGRESKPKPYLSFKFDSALVPELPLPKPLYEIFVYSPRVEGVHLRAGKVARGGLRWSDRREDFRTEVLGLMKAQQVKNAVIVPSGAKGGFVPKCLPIDGNREEMMQEVIHCYQSFIRGLLDITDNIKNGEVIPPADTVRYDGDDPYLVVAADKGTATFSDTANAISLEYDFWLGDAFASGGSAGYDHKKMGITARGAWESVKRHFRHLNINTQEQDFTVIGIGDMSGDVFGNGMLLSRHIKLLGAFNHMHIFIDPNPNPETSFTERERLFHLPRSTWEDYNSELISSGGGIFKRSAKSIRLSSEIKALFNISADVIEPNELIRIMLKAEVDLLWNGGIGTYVKASSELNADVGDRTNDVLRVNGNDLRCKVVGEGGNLGFTQLGRVEYDLNGGLIFTDFIDNSAGVDCSDHEVNIKILLNGIVTNGDITEKQRNSLLAQMTDEVASLVLADNYYQTQAISIAAAQAAANFEIYKYYIDDLERKNLINRALEFLPDDKTLLERKAMGKSLTRPELAILLAYTKIIVKSEILESNIPEDEYLSQMLEFEFPEILRKRYSEQMYQHSLRREIIATLISNYMINDMGLTFVNRLADETGSATDEIVRAYTIAREIFDARNLQLQIEALDYQVPAHIQIDMMTQMIRLIRRATRWMLRNSRRSLDVRENIQKFKAGIQTLHKQLPELLIGSAAEFYHDTSRNYLNANVPAKVAEEVAAIQVMGSGLDLVDASVAHGFDVTELAKVYFTIGDELGLGWFREQIMARPIINYWDSKARAALRDDLDWLQRGLAIGVMLPNIKAKDLHTRIAVWREHHQSLIDRWNLMLTDLRSSTNLEFTVFYVALREILDLTQASLHSAKSGAVA